MKFTNNPITVLHIGEIGESPETSRRKYFYADLQVFDGDLAGQHRFYAPTKPEIEALKKGNYLADIESSHGDFAALEYRLTNLRPKDALTNTQIGK